MRPSRMVKGASNLLLTFLIIAEEFDEKLKRADRSYALVDIAPQPPQIPGSDVTAVYPRVGYAVESPPGLLRLLGRNGATRRSLSPGTPSPAGVAERTAEGARSVRSSPRTPSPAGRAGRGRGSGARVRGRFHR